MHKCIYEQVCNDYDTPDGTGVRVYIHVVDLAKGHVNAVEYCSTMFGMPKLDELLDILDEDLVAVEEIV